jgi:ATP-dependent RNA helicase RhlE
MKFTELKIISPLQKALDKKEFFDATEIQTKVIPEALENNDILATAKTGS